MSLLEHGLIDWIFAVVKATVIKAVASVTALATGSVPSNLPAAGGHHPGFYSEKYVKQFEACASV